LVETRLDGTIELNETAKLLNARKRRVYDITNVLEGVGLLEKISKNNVRWIQQTDNEMAEKEERVRNLKDEICVMEEDLRKMEMGIKAALADVHSLNAESVKRHLFLRKSDILNLPEMKDRRCFAVKFSDEAQLCKRRVPSSHIQRLIASCVNGEVHVVELTNERSSEMEIDDASKENHS